MGQEVKNPLRAQSKYGLLGSSAKTEKKKFRGSPEHFLDKNVIWDGTPPHLHINCSLHVWQRAQGSQIFKWNSIISIRSKVMAFLVISLSPCGPCRPRVIPTSSPCCPRCPHVIPTLSSSSPSSPEGPHVVSMVCGLHMLSPSSPRRPCRSRVIPIIPTSSRRSLHHAQPPRYPLYSPPIPLGGWGPRISKNAIRFELIKIF